ncbi:MAG: PAS domain S-box protein [Gemmatimonadota bacterium]|nr:PAS domain S-box protein [Gemmatimonadota bacterium]
MTTMHEPTSTPSEHTIPENSAAVFVMDAAGVVSGWSPAAAGVTGYTAAEIVGSDVHALYPSEEQAEGHPSSDLTLAAGRGRTERQGWLQRKDGQKVWTDTAITALRSADGMVSGFACFIRDLAAQKAADARRRARGERLSALAVTRQDVAAYGLELTELLPRIVAHARELTGAEAAIVELRDGVGERARAFDGLRHLDVELGAVLIPQGNATAAGTPRCIRYDDTTESPEVLGDVCDRLGIGSMLAIPILHERATLGWLTVSSRASRAFSEQHAATLELMSTLLGAPLAQAQASQAQRTLLEERATARAHQRASEERFRAAMDASPDALFILGAVRSETDTIIDFVVLDANRRGEELGELAHDAFTGLRLAALPAAARQLPSVAALTAVMRAGQGKLYMHESTDAFGVARRTQAQVVPLADGVAVTVRDASPGGASNPARTAEG